MKRIKQYIMFGAAARMPRNLPSDAIPDGKTEDVCFTWTVHLTLVTTIFPGKDTKTWPTVI